MKSWIRYLLNGFYYKLIKIKAFCLRTFIKFEILEIRSNIDGFKVNKYFKGRLLLYYKVSLRELFRRIQIKLSSRKLYSDFEYANLVTSDMAIVNIDETILNNYLKRNYSWSKNVKTANI